MVHRHVTTSWGPNHGSHVYPCLNLKGFLECFIIIKSGLKDLDYLYLVICMRTRSSMATKHVLRLHLKLFFPLIGLLWLIIGITITYFVTHERERLKENLENRLLNVNSTVIEAYEQGAELQNTVDFIKLFTGRTALAPLRITVYSDNGDMIADNNESTIHVFDADGNMKPELQDLWDDTDRIYVHDVAMEKDKVMVCSKTSPDGRIHSFAALPYNEKVLEFFGTDPMVWVVVFLLGVFSTVLVYLGTKAVCHNVYALRDFADAISSNLLPDNVDSYKFSKDELGDVSRKLLTLYRDKLHAEQEKIHHERQISMNISHELNTPISIIKGYLDTMMSDPDMTAEIRNRFLVNARQGADRLINLIKEVNTVMRLQETGNTLECEAISINDIAGQLDEYINKDNIANGMKFSSDIPDNCIVMGHQSLLMNAMLNLTYNAARHSEGSRITLKWVREENRCQVFSFSDNGTGVGKEHIERLFDMFYRVDSGRSRKKGGSGLGLPLVRRIIEAMGGNITAQNMPAGGLGFIFSLPKVS